MKNLKRIMVFIFAVLLLAANLPLYVFADEVISETDKATACLPVIQIYGQSNNVHYIFDAETTAENIQMLLDLWGQYTTQVNNAITLDQMYNQIVTDNTYQLTQAGYLAFDISSSLSHMLTMFWDFVLSGPANMVKVDDQYYEWNVVDGSINPVSVYNNSFSIIGNYPFKFLPTPIVENVRNSHTYSVHFEVQGSSDVYYLSYYNSINYPMAFFFSSESASVNELFIYIYDNGTTYDSYNIYLNRYGSLDCYTSQQTWLTPNTSGTIISDIPNLQSFDINEFYSNFSANPSITTHNYDLSIVPYNDATDITIPSVSDTPVPVNLVSDLIPDIAQIEDETDLQAAAQDASDAIFDDQFGIQQDSPAPPAANEVFTPLLPIQLPSFNFSFSGIWHYVREWVGSINSWLSVMFMVWSHLPYAISVPVYASAVIVIVLGVYKRFFM